MPSQKENEFLKFLLVEWVTAKPPIILNSLMTMFYIVLCSLLPKFQDMNPCSEIRSR